jgi:SET domain-containing protein
MNILREYNINGEKIFMEQTMSICNQEKENQVNELLEKQEGLIKIYDEEDLSIYSSGNKDYIVIDGRTTGVDVLVSIKNVREEIKKGLENIFQN